MDAFGDLQIPQKADEGPVMRTYHGNHLGAIRRIDGIIDIGSVASELLQKLARLDAMDPSKTIIRAAEYVGTIS